MSANDPFSEQPAEVPDPNLPPADDSISGPPLDYQRTPPADGERLGTPPGWRPEVGLPERTVEQKPRWPHPNFWWALLWCVLFLLVTQVPGGIVAGVFLAAMMILNPQQTPPDTPASPAGLMQSPSMAFGLGIAFFITEVLVVGASWLVIRLVVGRDWTRQLALRRPSLAHFLLALASFPALVLFGSAFYALLRNVLHVPSFSDFGLGGMEEMVKVFAHWPWAFAVLVIGLGPGIGEELWCRGFLGRGLVGNYGAVLGVLASSFYFGLIHLDPCQGTAVILMGVWLHFVYLTTRSLWLPMLLHFLNNSLAVLASHVPALERLDSDVTAAPPSILAAGAVLLAGVAYALYQSRARLAPESSQQIVIWRPPYEGVEYPPPGSGMRVVHPTPSLSALALAGGGFCLFVAACVAAFWKST